MTAKQKLRFKDLPVIVRVAIYLGANYFLIFFLSQFIAGFLPVKGPIMINILLCILLVAFTAIILKLENMSFRDIGCVPGSRRGLANLAGGTLAGILMLVATAVFIKMLTGFHWERNQSFRWTALITGFVTMFCSVFAQELSFRGYPFRLMIDKWGVWPAQIVTAILFGMMHLSHEMSISSMLLTMLTTGIGSMLFGMLVIRTGRLHMAIGLHFGWNFTQLFLPRASQQNGGGIWLVTGGSYQPWMGPFIWIGSYVIVMITAYILLRRLPIKTV